MERCLESGHSLVYLERTTDPIYIITSAVWFMAGQNGLEDYKGQ